jgi:hypothetical protein
VKEPGPRIEIGKVSRLPELPISVGVRRPRICLEGRSFDGAILIRNKHEGEYPEKNKELIVDLQISPIGDKERTWELRPYHYHVRKLKLHEELRLNFKGLFKKSGVYEIKVSVTEAEPLETRGNVNYDEEHVIAMYAHEKICAGEGWQVRFSETGKGKSWGMGTIRCYSLYEMLTTLGSIAAIIAAISSVLTLILTLLR